MQERISAVASFRCKPSGYVWYAGRDGTERDEAFRPAFGAPKMGGTGCSTGQILGVFAFHLPPGTGLFHGHELAPNSGATWRAKRKVNK
ncbi:hypothetical protein DVH24_007402 [Malus domestica]|uniref:Uncharacterized protein n=1 Tax=Malus domestica TaxID=3750 RepID=A0A498HF89_MALDO|nr:hypothetical protein DVH24_007402 [Malus domestica]